jgi:hypothetical protein
VEDYTKRLLTKPSDKLAAFAGVTKQFPSKKPLAGIWADDIHFGLLWCCQIPAVAAHERDLGCDTLSLPESVASGMDDISLRGLTLAEGDFGSYSNVGGIPSWSWASVDVVTRSIFGRQSLIWKNYPRGVFRQMKLLDYTLDWSGDTLTSTLLHAHLKVRARLASGTVACEGCFLYDSDTDKPYTLYWPYDKNRWRYILWPDLESHERDKIHTGNCTFNAQPPPTGAGVFCVLVSTATTYEYCIPAESVTREEDEREGCEYIWKDPFGCYNYEHHFLVVEKVGNSPL